MKVDPKTANAIAQGRVTAVLREDKLAGRRQVLHFDRMRGVDDRPARHADDTTVLAARGRWLVTDQRLVWMHELTDEDAQALGFRSRFDLRQAWQRGEGPGYRDNETRCAWPRAIWLVSLEADRSERPRYVSPVGGYTESASRALDTIEMIVQTPSGPKRREVALEAVSNADLERYAKESQADRDRRRRREELDRRALSLEDRIVRARAEARRIGADLTRQEARALDALKAHNTGRAIAAVESMERKVRAKAA